MPLELKALYKGKLPNASPLKKLSEFLVEPVEPPIEPLENAAEPIDLQDVTEPIGLQSSVEQVDHQCVIEHVNLQEGSSDNPLEKISIQENSYVLIPETPDTPAAIKLLEMKAKSMESSSSDSVLNMMDGDLDSRGGYSNEQEDDGCSETTRVVARFLHHKFTSHREGEQKKTLNLSSFLQGSTRTKSAKVFYEILALRSFGCIDVTQDSPYSDIILSATSQLENILEKH
ncbi:sister chromatid cohesion 1 protein 3-like isoform X2 [Dioscorea cayenensis subsp. rotundata]|nr:sister chromatid cohesion 1 protein 3-like isoform X2 [Dioscorea cayenensis subsp. rotundata]